MAAFPAEHSLITSLPWEMLQVHASAWLQVCRAQAQVKIKSYKGTFFFFLNRGNIGRKKNAVLKNKT